MSNGKQYLGDAVYLEFEYGNIVLTTNNGIEETNKIILEPEVYAVLEKFVERERNKGR